MKWPMNQKSIQARLYQEKNIHQPSTPPIILVDRNIKIRSALTYYDTSFDTVVVPKSCHKWQQKYQLNVRGKSIKEFC